MKTGNILIFSVVLPVIFLSTTSSGGPLFGDVRDGLRCLFFSGTTLAFAEDDWKKEFRDVCSKTEDAMSLTKEELKALISRCDSLKARMEELDETQKKVYLRRLQLCRDLYLFVLESKEKAD